MKKVHIFSTIFNTNHGQHGLFIKALNDQINTFLASQENGLSKELISLTQSQVHSEGGINFCNQTLIITMIYDEK